MSELLKKPQTHNTKQNKIFDAELSKLATCGFKTLKSDLNSYLSKSCITGFSRKK